MRRRMFGVGPDPVSSRRAPASQVPRGRTTGCLLPSFVDSKAQGAKAQGAKAQGAKAQGAKVEAPPKPRSRTSTSYRGRN